MIAALKSQFRKQLLLFLRKIERIKVEIKCEHKWYGNKYGGFYVHPNLLNPQSIIYSFGIGEDISFDTAINRFHKCKVYMFDPTPRAISWVREQNLTSDFIFFEYGIGEKTALVDFYLPINEEHVSGSSLQQKHVDSNRKVQVQIKSFNNIANDLQHKHIDVLKMDIEGAEYTTVQSILKSPVTVDQILIEFHSRFFEDGKERTKNLLSILSNKGYKVFAVSDSFEEVSFIRHELIDRYKLV
jgi:FkbM family methyltransferase